MCAGVAGCLVIAELAHVLMCTSTSISMGTSTSTSRVKAVVSTSISTRISTRVYVRLIEYTRYRVACESGIMSIHVQAHGTVTYKHGTHGEWHVRYTRVLHSTHVAVPVREGCE